MQKRSDLLTPVSNLWAVEEGGGAVWGLEREHRVR